MSWRVLRNNHEILFEAATNLEATAWAINNGYLVTGQAIPKHRRKGGWPGYSKSQGRAGLAKDITIREHKEGQ